MTKRVVCALIAASMPCSLNAAEITLQMGGSAFRGGPAFALEVGGETVATGFVSDPVPPNGQTFKFVVADELLAMSETMRILFTNDLSVEGQGDRNLIVLSAEINGTAVPRIDVEQDGKIVRSDGALYGDVQIAVVALQTGIAVSAEPEPVGQVASEPACVPVTVEVDGFDSALVELTDAQKTEIDAATMSEACDLVVTGYASTFGPEDVNSRVSEARANAVLAYLMDSGVSYLSTEVVAYGETDQFGPDQASNRRVVVQALQPD